MNSTALALILYYMGLTTVPPPCLPLALALVAVGFYESGLNPGPQSGNTGGVLGPAAYGLFSWNGPRQAPLQSFAMAHGWNGTGVIPLDVQALFALTEMANSYPTVWAAYQQIQTEYQPGMSNAQILALANSFIATMVDLYEIPANPAPEIAGAQAYAASWLASGKIVAPTPAPVPVPTPTPSPTPVPTPAPSSATVIAEINDVIVLLQALLTMMGSSTAPNPATVLAIAGDAAALLQTLITKVGT